MRFDSESLQPPLFTRMIPFSISCPQGRLYLLWRWLRDLELNSMPKRHTIETFTGSKFGSIYVLKYWLHGWRASIFLLAVWLMALLMTSYWFRVAEMTACFLKTTEIIHICNQTEASNWVVFTTSFEHKNNYYIWDALWVMYITTMSC